MITEENLNELKDLIRHVRRELQFIEDHIKEWEETPIVIGKGQFRDKIATAANQPDVEWEREL